MGKESGKELGKESRKELGKGPGNGSWILMFIISEFYENCYCVEKNSAGETVKVKQI